MSFPVSHAVPFLFVERCLVADLPERFVIVNGMSANTGMRWDIEPTRRILGYQPLDGVMRSQ